MLIQMLKKLFLFLAAFDGIKLLRSEAATRGVLLQVHSVEVSSSPNDTTYYLL